MLLTMLICAGTLCTFYELPLPTRPSWFVGTEGDWCRATRDAWRDLNVEFEVQAYECHVDVIGAPLVIAGE